MKGCLFSAIGVISGFAVKAAAFFVNGILKTLASLLVFTGLYVPVFYLLYGGLLWWIAGFNPFDLSTDSMLYILGLCVCILCTLLIFVRNLIITPSHKIKEFFTARASRQIVQTRAARSIPQSKQSRFDNLRILHSLRRLPRALRSFDLFAARIKKRRPPPIKTVSDKKHAVGVFF